MPTRRQVLSGGLAALSWGLLGQRALAAGMPGLTASLPRPAAWRPVGPGSPLAEIPRHPHSQLIAGLPFDTRFTGDSWRDPTIPFHSNAPVEPPEPSEVVDVVVVGGGISGLSTAWLLREHKPIVFDLRERFGGVAMGETWDGVPYSLGSAYVITPDEGSFLERFYKELGVDALRRESWPPDPVELGGEIVGDFWTGEGLPEDEQRALLAYRGAVRYMAGDGYPEIPLSDDPESAAWVLELDGFTFREDLERRMGMPLTPLLAAGVQAYFYSSFCAGIDEISAAAGWNFLAAEEFGRWVFPGGNGALVAALHERLAQLEGTTERPRLRPSCPVVDVRPSGDDVLVTWRHPDGGVYSVKARHVVMAGSKHIAKDIIHGLPELDPEKWDAMRALGTGAYLVANVLLNGPIDSRFYDMFLVGDAGFPMDSGDVATERPVIDVLRGDYAAPNHDGRSVLQLYWPLPFVSARGQLLNEGYEPQAERLAPQLRETLALLGIEESRIEQIRLVRWGHGVPIARRGFILEGDADAMRRPIGGRIHFVNQDNWALPAVENSVLDAQATAAMIERHLGAR